MLLTKDLINNNNLSNNTKISQKLSELAQGYFQNPNPNDLEQIFVLIERLLIQSRLFSTLADYYQSFFKFWSKVGRLVKIFIAW